jgi:lysophospholipase L1-like esterase
MAFPLAAALAVGLNILVAAPGLAQASPPSPPPLGESVDQSLSPECRVPGSRLYTLASLRGVKRALREQRAIKVLAIGSSSTAGVGASSPMATYPARLEGELEKLFPNIEVDVVNRGMAGEIAAGAARRMKDAVADVEPDLVVWQVGTNDAIARVDVDTFAASLIDTVEWVKGHKIDVVLVDPQYTASLAKDDYYAAMVKTIEEVARKARVPLVRRYEAMRFMAARAKDDAYLARDHFHLNDLGYRCMAEHVARAVTVGLLLADPPPASADSATPLRPEPAPPGTTAETALPVPAPTPR